MDGHAGQAQAGRQGEGWYLAWQENRDCDGHLGALRRIGSSDAGKGRILVFMDGVRRLNTDKMIRDIIAAKKEFLKPRLGVVPVCKIDQEFMTLQS